MPQQYLPMINNFISSAKISPESVTSQELPFMHYVVVTGFNDETRTLFYIDTDNSEKSISFDKFESQFNWTLEIPQDIRNAVRQLAQNPLLAMFIGNVPDLLDVNGSTVIEVNPHTLQDCSQLTREAIHQNQNVNGCPTQ
jgi:hypothetical protein